MDPDKLNKFRTHAEWLPTMLAKQADADFRKGAEVERLCHRNDMLEHVERTIGIFFAREDD